MKDTFPCSYLNDPNEIEDFDEEDFDEEDFDEEDEDEDFQNLQIFQIQENNVLKNV